MTSLAHSFWIKSSSFLQITDIHESLDEFKVRSDTTTNPRVISPCVSEKLMYNVNTLVSSLLIGSSSFLQVMRTTIKSWTSSKFDQIRPWTAVSCP